MEERTEEKAEKKMKVAGKEDCCHELGYQ